MRVAVHLALLIAFVSPHASDAYGPAGHLIAGAAAEPLLCPVAASRIAELGQGQTLGELGLWADRIRSDDRWDHAAPWHYVNVESDLDALVHPPEGDVLWAIEHFTAELERRDTAPGERATALKFLIHFVVDLHQPLHVGLARDRGGNDVEVRYGATTTNLHAFWDTDVIALAGLGIAGYTARIADRVRRAYPRETGSTPYDWASEGLALRGDVYRFGAGGQLSESYLRAAQDLTRERLIRASARLAVTLNRVLCGSA